MVKKRKDEQPFVALTEPVTVIDETTPVKDIRAQLEDIRNCEGVVGYIQRNHASASIDLKDPTKIVDYAIISSSSIDAGLALSELFDLGHVKNVAVEGKNAKMLSFNLEGNKVSVIMDKTVDIERILKRLRVL